MAALVSRKYLMNGADAEQPPGLPPVQALAGIKPHAPRILPALNFTDADGRPHTLADYRGRGVLLNLWATWCVPCVSEMPALDALARGMKPDGPVVLTVSLDRGGADAVHAFFASHQIRSLPVLLDPHSTMLAALALDGIPTTLLVNKDGMEVARLQGPYEWGSPQAPGVIEKLIG